MSLWSQEQQLCFLELFQSEPVIWDPKEKAHKDKKKVNDAWIRIQEVMKIPIKDLKAKKDSLMATFRGYYRKKRTSLTSGAAMEEVYKPVWFAYDVMEQFLGPVYNANSTVHTKSNVSRRKTKALRAEDCQHLNDYANRNMY